MCILCCVTSILMCVSTQHFFCFPFCSSYVKWVHLVYNIYSWWTCLYATAEEAKWHNRNSTLNSTKNQVYERESPLWNTHTYRYMHSHITYALHLFKPPKRFCVYIATSQKALAAKAIIFTHQFILLVCPNGIYLPSPHFLPTAILLDKKVA